MNRLHNETSPYLLQHKDNPVNWFAWGPEAFDEARRFDKPILLSIGYSACHWCHVMAHESFENETIAALMNELFVNIKVDREERPDVDSIYMNFVQITTGSGGWPLTVFLTPDLIPFYGGTYFPPEDNYGRTGFRKLLKIISDTYRDRKDEIEGQKQEILSALIESSHLSAKSGPGVLTMTDFAQFYASVSGLYDERFGGFYNAPKFPMPSLYFFLLRYFAATRHENALNISKDALTIMSRAGIYDQIGGGFHRYATDNQWLIPHFEKMLYDNAQLMRLYTEAFRASSEKEYLSVAIDIAAYLLREMKDVTGGFYSAQDADSEGEEGKYFLFSYDELQAVLTREELKIAENYYGLSPDGNFEGRNIFSRPVLLNDLANQLEIKSDELKSRIDVIRNKLFVYREQRIKPGLDDKILTSWNSLTCRAFAELYGVTGNKLYLDTAVECLRFLWEKCYKQEHLFHSYKNGEARIEGLLDDYAFMCEALIAVYQVTHDETWLGKCDELLQIILAKFYDSEVNEFYYSAKEESDLIIRPVNYFDNAVPSGNSSVLHSLITMSVYMNKPEYMGIAEKYIAKMTPAMKNYPDHLAYMLSAAIMFIKRPSELAVLVHSEESSKQFITHFFNDYFPFAITAVALQGQITKLELLKGKNAEADRDIYYVCKNFACRQPVSGYEEMKKLLSLEE